MYCFLYGLFIPLLFPIFLVQFFAYNILVYPLNILNLYFLISSLIVQLLDGCGSVPDKDELTDTNSLQ
jgi:hypothetical protein